jgi:hypothetical protein
MNEVNYRSSWEKQTGMKIPKGYELHHINFNSDDNDLHNLALVTTEGHAAIHYQAGDTYSAELINSRISKVKKPLLRLSIIDDIPNDMEGYSQCIHSAVEVLSVRKVGRGAVSYSMVDLNTGAKYTEKMYDSFVNKFEHKGQYHPEVGERLNVRLSRTSASNKVFMAISNL